MKLAVEPREFTSHGVGITMPARIKASALAFKSLAGMYSDHIGAVVREITTNAYDGSRQLLLNEGRLAEDAPWTTDLTPLLKEMGRPLPKIHLPNQLEPWFEVEDSGIGMSPHDVLVIYNTFFASTKQQSDNQTGGFGLGCKTPHAAEWADVWTVTVRWEGREYAFHCTKTAEGMPTTFYMGETDELLPMDLVDENGEVIGTVPTPLGVETDRPNGVTVRVPVPVRHFQDFRNRAAYFLPLLPLEFEVEGDANFQPTLPTYLMQAESGSWGVKRESRSWRVIMGGVPYPLSEMELKTHGKITDKQLQSFSVDFYVPVGSVAITPNREALLYNEWTQATLMRVTQEFLQDVKAHAAKLIEDAETPWEAMQRLLESWSIPSLRDTIRGALWKGIEIDPVEGIQVSLSKLRAKVPGLEAHWLRNQHTGTIAISREALNETAQEYDPKSSGYVTREKTYSLSPMNKVFVFLDDLEHSRGTVGRVKYHLRKHIGHQRGYGNNSWQANGKSAQAFVFRAEGLTPKQLSHLLGGAPVERVSSLESPPRDSFSEEKGGTGGKARRVSVKRFTGWHFQDEEISSEDEGYFVRLNNNELLEFSGTSSLGEAIKLLQRLGVIDADAKVYGVPRSRSAVEKSDNLQDFYPLVLDTLQQLVRTRAQDLVDLTTWYPHMDNALYRFLSTLPEEKLPPKRGPMQRLWKAVQRAQALKKELDGVAYVACTLQVGMPTRNPTHTPEVLFEDVLKRYPMLAPLVAILDQPHEHRYRRLDYWQDTLLAYL